MGFDARYIEGISPAERSMHILYYREEEEKKRKARQSANNTPSLGGNYLNTMGE